MARGRGRLAAFAVGAGAGAAAEYLLDPNNGRRRRHVIRDKARSRVRRAEREARERAHYMANKAKGVVAEVSPVGHHDPSQLNDPALAAKAESELFRPQDAPKGSVNLNVEYRVLYLRGEVENLVRMEDLVERAERIEGIDKVESLLHLPGEPPKMKTD
jgi:osmotically-inducible protein OsmY